MNKFQLARVPFVAPGGFNEFVFNRYASAVFLLAVKIHFETVEARGFDASDMRFFKITLKRFSTRACKFKVIRRPLPPTDNYGEGTTIAVDGPDGQSSQFFLRTYRADTRYANKMCLYCDNTLPDMLPDTYAHVASVQVTGPAVWEKE